jgi:hypothetical protein
MSRRDSRRPEEPAPAKAGDGHMRGRLRPSFETPACGGFLRMRCVVVFLCFCEKISKGRPLP